MGIGLSDLEKLLTVVKKYKTTPLELSLVELGEQELKILDDELQHQLLIHFLKGNPRKWSYHAKPRTNRIGLFSKDYFNTVFSSVVTIDLKAHCPQTKQVDLGLALDEQGLSDTFDLLTNFGTTEHVGQYLDNSPNPQYIAFRNIHKLVKTNGLMFHNVPFSKRANKVQNHGAFNYDLTFFEELSNKCKYEVVYNELQLRGKLIHINCCLIKQDENDFITEKEFNKIKGIFTTKKCLKLVKQQFKRDRSFFRHFISRA
jgi:hypothetical protein